MSLYPYVFLFPPIRQIFIFVTLILNTHKKSRHCARGSGLHNGRQMGGGGVATKKPETLKKQPEGLRYM